MLFVLAAASRALAFSVNFLNDYRAYRLDSTP